MNTLIRRAKKIFRSKKGETLMESIVSMLVLSVLLAAITMMILTALKFTNTLTQRATTMQEEKINPAVLLSKTTGSGEITFTAASDAPDAATDISAKHNVRVYDDDGIIAFAP